MKRHESIEVSIDVTNQSSVDGYETIQLYIRDYSAEVSRPVQELKQFKKIWIKANTKETITFMLKEQDLVYVHSDLSISADLGKFSIQVGNASNQVLKTDITLI